MGSWIVDYGVVFHYLKWGRVNCPNCNSPVDLMEVLSKHLDSGFPFFLFGVLHARSTAFSLPFGRGRLDLVELGKYGVPSDATVLEVFFTAVGSGDGFLQPALVLSGRWLGGPLAIGNQFTLTAAALGERPPEEAEVNIMVTWLPASPEAPIWESLVEAFKAFGAGRLEEALLPAHLAVEYKLHRVLEAALGPVVPSRDRLREVLKDVGADGQLNVLLPAYCALKGLPFLPESIRGALGRLRNLRNRLAHTGTIDGPLQHAELARILASTLLTYRYLDALINTNLLNGAMKT